MKTLGKADFNKNNTTIGKGFGNRLMKLMLMMVVLATITFLSSCFIGPPRMGHERHEGYGRHDNGRHHGGGEHHDNGGQRD